ncbi:Methylthiotransferase [Gracilaria domingensis]|nr:Methylthiotransferase [Gracilaria domingensis]
MNPKPAFARHPPVLSFLGASFTSPSSGFKCSRHKSRNVFRSNVRRLTSIIVVSSTSSQWSPPLPSTKDEKFDEKPIVPLRSPTQRFYDFSNHTVEAIRLTHCRVVSDQMADFIETSVRSKRATLAHLATLLSTCNQTRSSEGDTGWITVPITMQQKASTQGRRTYSAYITDELLEKALASRTGSLQRTKLSYGWEIFTVTDVRHAVKATVLGATREKGFSVNPNMRRTSKKKPNIIPKSYFIQTFGCQMNDSDSEKIAAQLEGDGYQQVDDPNKSAIYMLNTCALRDHAQQKVYSYLGPHAQRKWDAPHEVTLVVAGCVAQQEGEALLSRVPEIDIVMGPQYANRFLDVMSLYHTSKTQVVAVDPIHIHEDISKPKRSSKLTAWVNVIYGCLERCTYCVVPNTRGLEQSRPMSSIREEIEALAAEGYREVVLLGQNVDAYGRDLFPKVTFSELLRYVHDVDGIERIRFTTGHPRYISGNLIDTVYELEKVMEHFHIPPQSGDSSILKAMKRGYTPERYLQIVRRIREKMPDASICADMIVGFPGETKEAFQNTVRLADEVVFDSNMVRAYSARPNTVAASLPDQVNEQVKMERLAIMNKKMKHQAELRSRRYLGRCVEVLVDSVNPKRKNEVSGRERTNRVVFFEGRQELIGKLVEVKVQEAYPFSLRGKITRILR